MTKYAFLTSENTPLYYNTSHIISYLIFLFDFFRNFQPCWQQKRTLGCLPVKQDTAGSSWNNYRSFREEMKKKEF